MIAGFIYFIYFDGSTVIFYLEQSTVLFYLEELLLSCSHFLSLTFMIHPGLQIYHYHFFLATNGINSAPQPVQYLNQTVYSFRCHI